MLGHQTLKNMKIMFIITRVHFNVILCMYLKCGSCILEYGVMSFYYNYKYYEIVSFYHMKQEVQFEQTLITLNSVY